MREKLSKARPHCLIHQMSPCSHWSTRDLLSLPIILEQTSDIISLLNDNPAEGEALLVTQIAWNSVTHPKSFISPLEMVSDVMVMETATHWGVPQPPGGEAFSFEYLSIRNNDFVKGNVTICQTLWGTNIPFLSHNCPKGQFYCCSSLQMRKWKLREGW